MCRTKANGWRVIKSVVFQFYVLAKQWNKLCVMCAKTFALEKYLSKQIKVLANQK